MRAVLFALTLGIAGAALLPMKPAEAWWDRFHHWHGYGYYGPRVIVGPPAPYYLPRPYAHWVPPHYNYYGRYVPGHWG